MRIYSNAYQLMSEMGRDLWEMGHENRPKTYQNKVIEGNPDFITKELLCEQYCLTKMPDPEWLFIYTNTHKWADAEFAERISGEYINPGEAYKLNHRMWDEFLVDGMFDYTYSERFSDIVKYKDRLITKLEAIISLLKDDNDTRKAVLPIFGYCNGNGHDDCDYYDGSARIPCSMYYDLLIRLNAKGEKQLNLVYHQRSSDFVGHFGDDVYLAWLMMEYIAEQVGVKPGYLYHVIDSLHCYQRDWHFLKTCIDDIAEEQQL